MEAHEGFRFEVPEYDEELGLGLFLTDTPGIGGRLRKVPEDFQVREDPGSVVQARGEGKYTLATVRARNWETNRLVRELSQRLRVSERSIFYTGTKDKRAVTVQNIAIPAAEDAVNALELREVEILETRRVDRAPKLGEHTGNAFKIRIREMDVDLDEALARTEAIVGRILAEGGFPNFFGPQRFGSVRPITHLVGREMLRGDLHEAVWTYIARPHALDPPALTGIREEAWDRRDPADALEKIPHRLDYERVLLHHLAKDPGDPAGALDRLPPKLTRLFISACQSLLFNRALTERARQAHPRDAQVGDLLFPADDDGLPDPSEAVPVTEANLARCRESTELGRGFTTAALPGHQAALADGAQGEIERHVLEEEGLTRDDFRVHEAPEWSSSGTRRAMWCPVERLSVDHGEDHNGPFIELGFFLPKGSYATCLLREVMKSDITSY